MGWFQQTNKGDDKIHGDTQDLKSPGMQEPEVMLLTYQQGVESWNFPQSKRVYRNWKLIKTWIYSGFVEDKDSES